jgi:hypothetical protein
MNIIYLHVPHTAGRVIKKYLYKRGFLAKTKNLNIFFVDNPKDFFALKEKLDNIIIYTIIRSPIDRLIEQFIYYSKNFKNLKNLKNVEHMNKNICTDLKKKLGSFNSTSLHNFIRFPENQNIFCKFLLGRQNLKRPICENDYKKIKILLKKSDKIIWDLYKKPVKVPQLEKLLNIPIIPEAFLDCSIDKHAILFKDTNLKSKIINLNKYDIKLYNYLKDNKN